MFLGLVTLAFLIAFALLYISKSFKKKPEGMAKAVDAIVAHLDLLAFWGTIYGLVAAVLAPVLINYNTVFLFVTLVANIMVVVMTLPFTAEKLLAKVEQKTNPAVLETLRDLVAGITRNEKIIGYAAGAVAFLMLAVMFR